MARFVNVDLLAEPGDRFEPGTYQPDSDRQTIGLVNGGNLLDGRPLAILGEIPTLLALADSLVASAWALKTAAEVAATQHESRTTGNFITADEAIAAFTPADPENAGEG